MSATRRDVLRIGGLAALGVAGAVSLLWAANLGATSVSTLDPSRLQPFRTKFARPRVVRPYKSSRDRDGQWVDHYELAMRRTRVQVLPGLTTTAYGCSGHVPGPTVKVRRGRRSVIRFRNHLPVNNPQLGAGWKRGQPDPNDPILAVPSKLDNLPR
jgi:spore coat protein A, manganese oxidase